MRTHTYSVNTEGLKTISNLLNIYELRRNSKSGLYLCVQNVQFLRYSLMFSLIFYPPTCTFLGLVPLMFDLYVYVHA